LKNWIKQILPECIGYSACQLESVWLNKLTWLVRPIKEIVLVNLATKCYRQ